MTTAAPPVHHPTAHPAPPVALVTGADEGPGRETAHRLLEAGHTVHLAPREARGAEAAVRMAPAGRGGPTGRPPHRPHDSGGTP